MTRARYDALAPEGRPFLTFIVEGRPVPQGSKSYLGQTKAGKPMFKESSERLPTWRKDVRDAARQVASAGHPGAVLWEGPTFVSITFRFHRPKGHYRTGKNAHLLRDGMDTHPSTGSTGDLDKLVRAVLDAMTSVVYEDDKRVVGIHTSKVYAEREGASITVQAAAPEADMSAEFNQQRIEI